MDRVEPARLSVSRLPAYTSVPHYAYDPWWLSEPEECGATRDVAEVLWSLTATYIACLLGM